MADAVYVVLLWLLPAGLLAVGMRVPRWYRWAAKLARRLWRRGRPEVPASTRLPLERLAADVRRLRSARLSDRASRSMTQRRALEMAYDDRLCDVCEALQVPQEIRVLQGFEREFERLRVEEELVRAGLDLGPAHREPGRWTGESTAF